MIRYILHLIVQRLNIHLRYGSILTTCIKNLTLDQGQFFLGFFNVFFFNIPLIISDWFFLSFNYLNVNDMRRARLGAYRTWKYLYSVFNKSIITRRHVCKVIIDIIFIICGTPKDSANINIPYNNNIEETCSQ